MLSPASYNKARGMTICCPMTSKIKGYSFEVDVSTAPASAVLSDEIKNVDWRARHASFEGNAAAAVLADVRAKINVLLSL